MSRYLALLRGINVGGKNIIKMTDLAACFEAQGLRDVVTYIQSGNVVFDVPAAKRAGLAARLEQALAARFDYAACVVVRSHTQLRRVIADAPAGFGGRPAQFRYDVIFLKEPLTAAAAIEQVPARPGVDQVHAGTGVVYASRLISRASQSRLSRLTQSPIYPRVTIRNWNTTTRLLALMDGD